MAIGNVAQKRNITSSAGMGMTRPATSVGSLGGGVSSGSVGGGVGGGGSIGGGGGQAYTPAPATAPPAPAAPSDDDYLKGDASYIAQQAALVRALSDYLADDTAQRTKYNTDYSDTMKNLGFQGGQWNLDDLNTASGRSNQNQVNDFAGRGLLQSSLYGQANENLMRSLNDQRTGIDTAKTSFLGDRDRSLAAQKNQNTLDQQSARAEALARKAALYAL